MKPIEIDQAIASIPVGGSRVILGAKIAKTPGKWDAGYTYYVEGVERPWTRRHLLQYLTRTQG